MSFTVIPASAIALRAASMPRWDEPVPGSTYLRSRTPVRWTIHSSDVSIRRVSSSFFTTRGGRARPVPMIRAPRISSPTLRDQHGRGQDRGVLVFDDGRLRDVEGTVDLPADLPHLPLLVPALVLVEFHAERRRQHRRRQVLRVVPRHLLGLSEGVVLAQVAVHRSVRGERTPDGGGDQPPRFVAAAPAHDHEDDLAGGEQLETFLLLYDPAFRREDARHLDEVVLLDPGVPQRELERGKLLAVAADPLGEEDLRGNGHARVLLRTLTSRTGAQRASP